MPVVASFSKLCEATKYTSSLHMTRLLSSVHPPFLSFNFPTCTCTLLSTYHTFPVASDCTNISCVTSGHFFTPEVLFVKWGWQKFVKWRRSIFKFFILILYLLNFLGQLDKSLTNLFLLFISILPSWPRSTFVNLYVRKDYFFPLLPSFFSSLVAFFIIIIDISFFLKKTGKSAVKFYLANCRSHHLTQSTCSYSSELRRSSSFLCYIERRSAEDKYLWEGEGGRRFLGLSFGMAVSLGSTHLDLQDQTIPHAFRTRSPWLNPYAGGGNMAGLSRSAYWALHRLPAGVARLTSGTCWKTVFVSVL